MNGSRKNIGQGYLEAERRKRRWDGEAPAPPMPQELLRAMSERYLEVFCRITGRELAVGGDTRSLRTKAPAVGARKIS